MTGNPPRVAFFTDCFHEVNGVALTSRQLDAFAHSRALPFFSVHVGPQTTVKSNGAYTRMELRRSLASVPLDAGMSFDVFCLRYWAHVKRELRRFRPDLIHITGPGDCGLLGALLARQLRVPLVASWHTNLHEFGARRLERLLIGFVPQKIALRAGHHAERWVLRQLQRFYGLSRVLLAPNPELIDMLESATGKRTFLMQRGVDATLYSPERRDRTDEIFSIGYVGRLSPEKNVSVFAEIERHLIADNLGSFRITVVGQGSEREWLKQNVSRAEFAGVLQGNALARAYANMDVFVFPSETDTFGNVVLEALASGLPTVVASAGGPKFLIEEGITGFAVTDASGFATAIATLMRNPSRRLHMAQAARASAVARSWDSVFEKVYEAYGQALAKSSNAAPSE